MKQLFLEYCEEDFSFENEDSSPEELSYTSIKEFHPRCLYKNPIEDVDIKIISVDFDPKEDNLPFYYCVIASFVQRGSATEEDEMLWALPYISRTRRECLKIKQQIETESINEINGQEFPWNREGCELENIDILFLPTED